MVSRVVVTLKLLYVLSVWVPSSKSLPQMKEAAPGGNERCNQCEDLIKMGASPDGFLRAPNRNAEPDLPPERFSDKAEDIKKAAALFLKYCSLKCKKVVETPEEENPTELATEEFRPRMAVESPTANSEPANAERTSPRTTMRPKVERPLFSGDSHDGAPLTESYRFSSSYPQNQLKLSNTDNTYIERAERDTETSEPEMNAPSTTEAAPITTVQPNAAEAPSEISSTTPRVTPTTKQLTTPGVTTSKPTTTECDQKTKPEGDAEYSDIEDIILQWVQNAAELLSCLLEEIITDLGLTVNTSIRLLLRERCENAADPQALLPLMEDSARVYSEQLIDAIIAEDILDDLEDVSLRSGLAAGNDDTRKTHSNASGLSAGSGHRKPFRVSETKDGVSGRPKRGSAAERRYA